METLRSLMQGTVLAPPTQSNSVPMIAQHFEGFAEVVLRARPPHGEIIAMIPNGTPVELLGREQEGYVELRVCISNIERQGWAKKSNIQAAALPPAPPALPPTAPAPAPAPVAAQACPVQVSIQMIAHDAVQMIAQQSEGLPEVALRAAPPGGEIIALIPNGTPVKLLGRELVGYLELEVCHNNVDKKGWMKKANIQEKKGEKKRCADEDAGPDIDGSKKRMEDSQGPSAASEFCALTGCDDREAAWYLKACGGNLQLAADRFLRMRELSSTADCNDWVAWDFLMEAAWNVDSARSYLKALKDFCARSVCREQFARDYLRRAQWNAEVALAEYESHLRAVHEFCGVTGCKEGAAWKFVRTAKWKVDQAILDYTRKDDVYFIACPYNQYGECNQTWPVSHADLNCRMVRCGIVKWRGEEHQVPRHGSRLDVERFLMSDGVDWPGEVVGCGRPFAFPEPDALVCGNTYDGKFLSWDDKATGSLEEIMAADPEGDYTQVRVTEATKAENQISL